MMFTKKKEPFLIGVAGGISSGKSSVCRKIIEELELLNDKHKKQVLIISLDSFYKKLTAEQIQKAERGALNLDHPDSFDENLATETIMNLMEGNSVKIPVYDKMSYRTVEESVTITKEAIPDVIILEGILVFYYPKIRELCNMKLFVDCDADTRLSRRVQRDMEDYKRPLEHILNYYQNYVKPAFEEFCLPTKKYADVIIPRGAENSVAINLIVQHINDYLNMSASQANKVAYSESTTPLSVQISKSNIQGPRSPITIQTGLNASSSSSSIIISGQSSPSTPSKRTETSSRPH